MKKVLLSVAGLIALVGAYVAYPYYSVNRLGAAVSAGDPEKLQVLVDWDSVRDGLKADLNVLLSGAVTQTAGDSPGRALRQIVLEVLGPKVIENAAETYTTPEGFAELIRSGGAIDVKAAASRTIASMNEAASQVDISSAEPSGPLGMEPQADAMTDPADAAKQPDDFSITVKAVRFVGVNAMEVEFATPDQREKAPVRGIMKLQGAKWKVTRLILPVDEMLDAPQTAEMPPQ